MSQAPGRTAGSRAGRFAVLLAACATMLAGAASSRADPPPHTLWKSGAVWNFFAHQDGKPQYRVYVVALEVKDPAGKPVWQLHFNPGEGAPPQVEKYRLDLDRSTGVPKAAVHLPTSRELAWTRFGTAPVLDLPPETMPLEWLAAPGFAEGRSQAAGTDRHIEFRKQAKRKHHILELAMFDRGVEQWSVHQLWVDGEPWWRTHERFVKGAKTLSVRRLNVVALDAVMRGEPSDPQEFFAKHHPLGLDPKLRVPMDLPGDPQASALLERLNRATGLSLTLQESLVESPPDYRGVSPGDQVACYIVMEVMAKHGVENGRWVKTDAGYRLEGESRALRLPAPRPVWPWLVAGSGLIAAAGAGYCWRRKRSAPAEANAG